MTESRFSAMGRRALPGVGMAWLVAFLNAVGSCGNALCYVLLPLLLALLSLPSLILVIAFWDKVRAAFRRKQAGETPGLGPVAGLRAASGTWHGLPVGRATVVGRSAGCDLVLAGEAELSRRHAEIRMKPAAGGPPGWEVVDLGSRAGTFVNGARLGGVRPIETGDRIAFGPDGPELTFEARGSLATETIEASALALGDLLPIASREVRYRPFGRLAQLAPALATVYAVVAMFFANERGFALTLGLYAGYLAVYAARLLSRSNLPWAGVAAFALAGLAESALIPRPFGQPSAWTALPDTLTTTAALLLCFWLLRLARGGAVRLDDGLVAGAAWGGGAAVVSVLTASIVPGIPVVVGTVATLACLSGGLGYAVALASHVRRRGWRAVAVGCAVVAALECLWRLAPPELSLLAALVAIALLVGLAARARAWATGSGGTR